MKLPFKPHLLVLLCSAGLFAASGVMFVKRSGDRACRPRSRRTTTGNPCSSATAPVVAPAYTAAQIDQWVAPIALYPDALLSQILMASTYPANVIQAAQWSKDNPKMEGDAAIQAVASQPWDPSVKSLVAFLN
ncbi:protein YacH [Enterobacter cloacae]|uniref:Protein YacH n=1 Tax=Enterobacter cloacae TaxID=550 RepID=A0A377M9L8_ENTCL|nr:protein YacH [Enterobacter cloacae]